MIDTSELLQLSRGFHRESRNLRGIDLRNEELRKVCYQNVDVNLARVADIAGWFKFWEANNSGKIALSPELLPAYVEGLDSLLWLAQVEQWMHLVVLEPAELTKLASFPHGNLNNHYLGLKSMTWNCYLRHSQADYSHLWRSYLKLGLVELSLSEDEIMAIYREKYTILS